MTCFKNCKVSVSDELTANKCLHVCEHGEMLEIQGISVYERESRWRKVLSIFFIPVQNNQVTAYV